MNSEELPVRLERLEASVAHLERLVDQLNEALTSQGRQLTRLQKRTEQLGEALEAQEQAQSSPTMERPPHYGR